MRRTYKGLIALVLALAELSLLPVLLDIGGKGLGVIPELFYAFLIGSITSLAVSYYADRMEGLRRIVKSGNLFFIIIAVGLFNDVIAQLLLAVGTVGTNPIIAATVFRSWVIFAALLVPITLRQKVTKMQMLATVIGFAGVYLLASNGSAIGISLVELPFILILLASAFVTVFPNLAMKRYNVDTVGAVAIFNVASLAFISVLVPLTGSSIAIPTSASTIFAVLFLGVATYGIGTSLYYYALKTFGPLFMGNSILVVPFLTIVLSLVILGTQFQLYYLAAALLLSAGIVVQQRFAKAPEHIRPGSVAKELQIFDITSAFVNNKDPEIASCISGDNRALAVKLPGHVEIDEKQREIFSRYGCIAFTNKDAHPGVMQEELDFVNEIMGASSGSTVVIGIGYADKLDTSFAEFVEHGQEGGAIYKT